MGTAVVTGATAGIGHAIATRLAGRGQDLVVTARDEARLHAVADDLTHRFGGSVEVLAADLGDPVGCARVEARLADADRPVDLLVNNAGVTLRQRFLHSSVEAETAQLDLMVRAVMRLTHAVLPGMVARGRGGVLNVSSVAGFVPAGTYGAAKAWVTSFSEGLAVELAGTGVDVVAVCPGYTRTEFHARAQANMSHLPPWLWLDADDVAVAALDALGRRVVEVPSARYKVIAALGRHAPRGMAGAVRARMSGRR